MAAAVRFELLKAGVKGADRYLKDDAIREIISGLLPVRLTPA